MVGEGRPCVERGTLLPSSIKSLGLWVYMLQTASTHSVKRSREGESLSGLRSSAAPLLVALEVPAAPGVSVPVWREIRKQAAAAAAVAAPAAPAAPAAWLSTRPEHCHSKQSLLLKSAQCLLFQKWEWNMATGTYTGQHQASFSTLYLLITWFNIKWLFYSNCPSDYSY